MESVTVQQDPIQFVSQLELQQPKQLFRVVTKKGGEEEALVREGEEQAFISDKSLVSFVSGVDGQNRKDVLNSTLLAQLAANKKYSLETDMQAWYQAFLDVLKNIGWQIEETEINNFESKHDIYEVDKVVIEILASAFGAGYIAIIKNTLESIKKMSDQESGKIKAFERNTQTLQKGCFQIGLAVEKNNAVTMQLGTFMLTTSNKMRRILFIEFSKDKTKLEYSSSRATLNPNAYAKVRKTVEDKLGEKIEQYVAEIDL